MIRPRIQFNKLTHILKRKDYLLRPFEEPLDEPDLTDVPRSILEAGFSG